MKHYIYIPGLNDRLDLLRRFVLLRWKNADSRVILVPMHWSDKTETYEQKYDRLQEVINRVDEDDTLILVGESAGGSMALLTYMRLPSKIHSVITICGYNHGSVDIHEHHRRNSPALFTAVQETEKHLPAMSPEMRRRITTIYSTKDTVVTPDHTRIDGSMWIEMNTPGHLKNIGRILLAGPTTLQQDKSSQ